LGQSGAEKREVIRKRANWPQKGTRKPISGSSEELVPDNTRTVPGQEGRVEDADSR
ncbi:hypothetical protein KI387_011110, partial [Taxus chinensis]